MNVAVLLVDVAAFGAFAFAALLLVTAKSGEVCPLSPIAKLCLTGALAVYVFAMLSNTLEHAGLTPALDVAEDYLEIMFPALFIYGGHAIHMHERESELRSAQRAALRSQEMLLGIIDAAPAGIIVLDAAGRITFANETAKEALDLTEEEGTIRTPGWSVRVGDGPAGPDFAGLVAAEHGRRGIPVVLEWPNGWRVELVVRTEELHDERGRFGGMVATFLPQVGLRQDSGD